MAAILVYSENEQVAFELLGKAREIGEAMNLEVTAAVLGSGNPEAYLQRGAVKVYTSGNELLQNFEASVYAQALAQVVNKAEASIILTGSTRRGKELAARLAQKLGSGYITDVNRLVIEDEKIACSRNAFGGATVATQSIMTGIQVIAVMPKTFDPEAPGTPNGEVIEVSLDLKPSPIKVLEQTPKDKGSADIEGAPVLVCVGKGLGSENDLKMVEELAEALGGLVACTKPVATDQKWLPEDRIIGLSGKKAKPELAICLGISGQVQFTVGIRDAKTIVAVNTEQNAYIFQMADYGIIGDLHQVVPELTKAIKG